MMVRVSGRGLGLGLAALMLAGPVLAQAPAQPAPQPPAAPAQVAPPTQPAAPPPPSLADLLERVVPAVVSVSVRSEAPAQSNPLFGDPFFRRFFGGPQQPQQPMPQMKMSAGSGVIVDASQGLILTNHHVVADAGEVSVTLADGRTLPAELVGSDQATDIGLLRVEADNLTQIEMADSSQLRVGDYVVAIGNPFGLGQTVTSGIVSALGRSGLNIEGYEDFIQTDASINPGNSGGALIGLDGRLVGINTAILAPSGGNVGIGFAIPTNMAAAVMNQLNQFGEVQRGQLGVTIQDITPDLVQALGIDSAEGALIASVVPGGAAETAGLMAGDVVRAVNDRPVRNSTELRNSVGLTPVGETVRMLVWRDGQEMEVSATIAETETQAAEASGPLAGASFADAQAGMGAEVAEVAQGSPAAAAGLMAGDVIVAVNRQPVADAAALNALLPSIAGTLALQLIRDGQGLILVVR